MGFIADTVKIDGSSQVVGDAQVEGHALLIRTSVSGSAVIRDNAVCISSNIFGSAEVSGSASVASSHVDGNVKISGKVKIYDSTITGSSHVYGNAEVNEVLVEDNSHIFGNARLFPPYLYSLVIGGNSRFGGSVRFDELISPQNFVDKYGADKVAVDYEERIVTLTDVWDMG